MYLKNKAFRFDLWTFVLSSKLSCSKANKELCHTGSMTYTPSKQYQWVSQNIDDHILLSFFIILMNEKGVSISVYLENKTTIIRLSPCVHITFWTVTFRFLWMLTSYVTGGCCHISVVSRCYGSPLMLNYSFEHVEDYHISVIQKLRHSVTCNQVKSCTNHGRPDQSQRELTVALNLSKSIFMSW